MPRQHQRLLGGATAQAKAYQQQESSRRVRQCPMDMPTLPLQSPRPALPGQAHQRRALTAPHRPRHPPAGASQAPLPAGRFLPGHSAAAAAAPGHGILAGPAIRSAEGKQGGGLSRGWVGGGGGGLTSGGRVEGSGKPRVCWEWPWGIRAHDWSKLLHGARAVLARARASRACAGRAGPRAEQSTQCIESCARRRKTRGAQAGATAFADDFARLRRQRRRAPLSAFTCSCASSTCSGSALSQASARRASSPGSACASVRKS